MPALKFEGTVTDRYQTTIPSGVRNALRLGQRDRIVWEITPEGKVLVAAKREEADHEDPVLDAFLSLLERDIAAGTLLPAGALFARMTALVGDDRVDLDAPLPDEDEDE